MWCARSWTAPWIISRHPDAYLFSPGREGGRIYFRRLQFQASSRNENSLALCTKLKPESPGCVRRRAFSVGGISGIASKRPYLSQTARMTLCMSWQWGRGLRSPFEEGPCRLISAAHYHRTTELLNYYYEYTPPFRYASDFQWRRRKVLREGLRDSRD